jgi:hypothetical protein
MKNDSDEGDSASLVVKWHLEKNRNIFFLCNENESAQNLSEPQNDAQRA